jgi:uncharacterized protein (TIGR04255 family)
MHGVEKIDNLAHSPLAVVLFQLVFSPILEMEKYIPEIQGILRKIEFPNYREIHGKRLVTDENGQMALSDSKQWVFSDSKMQTSVILDCQSITFQTFRYDQYEKLADIFIKSMVAPFFSSIGFFPGGILKKIGIRYVNRIIGPDWRNYLDSSYREVAIPPNCIVPDTPVMCSSYTQASTNLSNGNTGILIIKLYQNDGGILLPQDVESFEQPKKQQPKSNEIVTFIDIDHVAKINAQAKISCDDIRLLMDGMHDITESVFFSSITQKARTEWL